MLRNYIQSGTWKITFFDVITGVSIGYIYINATFTYVDGTSVVFNSGSVDDSGLKNGYDTITKVFYNNTAYYSYVRFDISLYVNGNYQNVESYTVACDIYGDMNLSY